MNEPHNEFVFTRSSEAHRTVPAALYVQSERMNTVGANILMWQTLHSIFVLLLMYVLWRSVEIWNREEICKIPSNFVVVNELVHNLQNFGLNRK